MIYLCTGTTENYLSRAASLIDSATKHEPDRFRLFTVNCKRPNSIFVDLAKCQCQLPKAMLQNGNFYDFVPDDWSHNDVVIFCDADAILQRPFSFQELDFFLSNTGFHKALLGRNKPDPNQTLADEATALFPKVSPEQLSNLFYGYETMRCYNTGFIVASLKTWLWILEAFTNFWKLADQSFDHYAKVQFTICYVLGRYEFEVTDVPLSIHTHNHHGLPEGVTKKEGLWHYNDEVIAYAHAL